MKRVYYDDLKMERKCKKKKAEDEAKAEENQSGQSSVLSPQIVVTLKRKCKKKKAEDEAKAEENQERRRKQAVGSSQPAVRRKSAVYTLQESQQFTDCGLQTVDFCFPAL
jgi:hypothetical protein